MRTLIKNLLLIFCLCSICQAAQVIRYVDPDAPGPAHDGTSWNDAYLSLSTWEAAEQTNLDAANNYMTVYCRSSAGTNDATPCTINGFTTSVDDYIEIIGTDFPADGLWDDSAYILENASAAYALAISDLNVTVRNLQVLFTRDGTNARSGILVGAANTTLDSLILKADGVESGTNKYNVGVYINVGNAKVYNCLIYGLWATHTWYGLGFYCEYGPTPAILNCTVEGTVGGTSFIRYYNCNPVITNCANVNSGSFGVGAISTPDIDNCISTTNTGTNPQAPVDTDWDNEFTNIAGGDFSLVAGGNCIGNGLDDPSSGLYLDDIIGTVRNSTWDIGAFELAGAAPPAAGGQLIMIQEF